MTPDLRQKAREAPKAQSLLNELTSRQLEAALDAVCVGVAEHVETLHEDLHVDEDAPEGAYPLWHDGLATFASRLLSDLRQEK